MVKKVIHSLRIKTINKFLLLLLLSSQLHASQLRGFCFPSNIPLDQVRHTLKQIELPTDKTSYRFSENCLEANLDASRNSLYKAFLSSKFPILRSYSNSNVVPGQNCKIEIITEEQMTKKTKIRRIGGKLILKDLMNNSGKTNRSTIIVSAGHLAYIDVNDQSVGVSCNPMGKTQVVLKVNLQSSAQKISTNVNVRRGERFNLGSVVEDLNSKNRGISLNTGLSKRKVKGHKTSKYFLIVK